MATQELAAALQRAEAVLQRRPEMGLHEDAAASARWQGGTRVVTSHANGTSLTTDMPCELGGTGDRVTPGWLFRAGIASCCATSVAMAAAAEGVDLEVLEVHVGSRSDTRGLLGMRDESGEPVGATPQDYELRVRAVAPGIAPERLRALVDAGLRRSPMPNALQSALPLRVRIDVGDH